MRRKFITAVVALTAGTALTAPSMAEAWSFGSMFSAKPDASGVGKSVEGLPDTATNYSGTNDPISKDTTNTGISVGNKDAGNASLTIDNGAHVRTGAVQIGQGQKLDKHWWGTTSKATDAAGSGWVDVTGKSTTLSGTSLEVGSKAAPGSANGFDVNNGAHAKFDFGGVNGENQHGVITIGDNFHDGVHLSTPGNGAEATFKGVGLIVNGKANGEVYVDNGGTLSTTALTFGNKAGARGLVKVNSGGELDVSTAILDTDKTGLINKPDANGDGGLDLNGGVLKLTGNGLFGKGVISNAQIYLKNDPGQKHDADNNKINEAGNGVSTIDTNGNKMIQIGDVTGAGGLDKTGNGDLILAGNNAWTGATEVAQGGLVIDGAAGKGALSVGGVTINQNGSFTAKNGAKATITGATDIKGGKFNTYTGSTATLASVRADGGSMWSNGGSTITVNGDSSLKNGASFGSYGDKSVLVLNGKTDIDGSSSLDAWAGGHVTLKGGDITVAGNQWDSKGNWQNSYGYIQVMHDGSLVTIGDKVNGNILNVDGGQLQVYGFGTGGTQSMVINDRSVISKGALVEVGNGHGTSVLTNNGDMTVTDSHSRINVNDDGILKNAGSITLQSGGTLDVSTTKDRADFQNTGALIVANGGSLNVTSAGQAHSTVEDTGSLKVTGGNVSFNAANLDVGTDDTKGSFDVSSGSATFDKASIFHVYKAGTFSMEGGTVNLIGSNLDVSGGKVDIDGGQLNYGTNGITISRDGVMNVEGGGIVSGNGDVSVGTAEGGTGTLNISGGGMTTAPTVVVSGAKSQVNVNYGGYLNAANGIQVNDGTLTLGAKWDGNPNDATWANVGILSLKGDNALSVGGGKIVANNAFIGSNQGNGGFTTDANIQDNSLGGGKVPEKNMVAVYNQGLQSLTFSTDSWDRNDSNDPKSGQITYGGIISGDGGVSKMGGGNMTVTRAQAYTGETDIDQGTLTLAGDGSLSKSSGVNVNQYSSGPNSTFDVSGLAKGADGLNVQNLSGNGIVNTGSNTLAVHGVFTPGQDARAYNSATTGQPPHYDNGDYGKMTVTANGGGLKLADNSQMKVDLGPNGQAGSVDVQNGSFSIGSNVGLTADASSYRDATLDIGQSYDIVHADNGVNGKFSSYGGNGQVNGHALLDWTTPAYTKTDVTIGLIYNGKSFTTGARTRNQMAAGHGLDGVLSAMGSNGNSLTRAVAGLGDNQRYGALDQLSGETNASSRTAMINDAFFIRDAALNRLDCADDEFRQTEGDKAGKGTGYCHNDTGRKYTLWGTVYGSTGGNAGRAGVIGGNHLNDSSMGWIMGADGLVGQSGVRIGAMMAYGRNWFSARNATDARGRSNNATIGAYVGKAFRVGGIARNAQITTKAGVAYSWDIISQHRNVRFGNYAGDHLSNDSLGGTGQVFGETGYRFVVHPARALPLEIEPFARMTYLNYRSGAFKEHGGNYPSDGSGSAALQGRAQDSSMGFSTTGMKFSTRAWLFGIDFRPHVELAYRRAFGRTRSALRERFRAKGRHTVWDMSVMGAPVSINTALLETGVSANLTDRLSLDVNYIGQYGSSLTTSGGTGGLKWKF